jgi:hypothetical protein
LSGEEITQGFVIKIAEFAEDGASVKEVKGRVGDNLFTRACGSNFRCCPGSGARDMVYSS